MFRVVCSARDLQNQIFLRCFSRASLPQLVYHWVHNNMAVEDPGSALIDAVCQEAIERILASISKSRGTDGLRSAFLFGKPGAPIFNRNLGIEIFYSRKEILSAALFVRANGPEHLRLMAVKDIHKMLSTFVTEHFWYLADETMFTQIPGPF